MRWMMRMTPVVSTMALLAVSAAPAAAQGTDGPFDLQASVDEFAGLAEGGVAAVTIRDGVVSTAAAGIANNEGEPMTVDTQLLVGGASVPVMSGIALQLVEEGLLDLDAAVVDYLPDAPVHEATTVRDLLTGRHAIPWILDTVYELSIEDPDRSWTTDEMLDLVDRSAIAPATGEHTGGYVGTLVAGQLIEAVTGTDLGSALETRIADPLGLDATVHPSGDIEAPDLAAGGWPSFDGQTLTYVTDELESVRSLRPTVSSARDLATYLSAYLDGQVVSPELLDETAFDKDLEIIGYGFLRPDELFPTAGPLGTDYFGIHQYEEAGVTHVVAGAPATGDVVVVVTNSWELDSSELAQDIVRSWAPDPLASGNLTEADIEFRFVMGTFTCDAGQGSPLDLPPCEMDETAIQLPFALPYEISGALEGSGVETGLMVQRFDDGTFTYTGEGVFMGEIEGCGSGTLYFRVDDGAGYFGDGAIHYTHGTGQILPGGTLPVAGTIDLIGVQQDQPDGTAIVESTSSYTCDGLASAS